MKWKISIESRTRIKNIIWKKRYEYLLYNYLQKSSLSHHYFDDEISLACFLFLSLPACSLSNLTFCSLRTFLLFSSNLTLVFHSLLCLLSFVTSSLQLHTFQTFFKHLSHTQCSLYTMLSSAWSASIFIYRHYKQKIRLSFCIRPSWGAGNAKPHVATIIGRKVTDDFLRISRKLKRNSGNMYRKKLFGILSMTIYF